MSLLSNLFQHQLLIWGELIAELIHLWSQKELDMIGKKEPVAPGVKHQPTAPKVLVL